MPSNENGILKLLCTFKLEVYRTSTIPLRNSTQTKRLIPKRHALAIKSFAALKDFIFLLPSTKIKVLG